MLRYLHELIELLGCPCRNVLVYELVLFLLEVAIIDKLGDKRMLDSSTLQRLVRQRLVEHSLVIFQVSSDLSRDLTNRICLRVS